MPLLTHTLANGHTIQLHLSRRAKKNIILRARTQSAAQHPSAAKPARFAPLAAT